MRALVDTNVVLDVLLQREPYWPTATKLMGLVESRRIDGLVCATSVTTVYYLARKAGGRARARSLVSLLLSVFEIAPVVRSTLVDALASPLEDFEDAVAYASAKHAGATAIVTRDKKGFSRGELSVYEADEIVRMVDRSGA